MKVYKVELIIIDHDGLGERDIKNTIENNSWPNDCISPHVVGMQSRDIGEWSDDNPLNGNDTFDAEVKRLFPSGSQAQG